MTYLYNKKEFTPLRRKLRSAHSPVEQKLWDQLRRRQMLGYKFRRQYGVGKYVIDFFCPELRLSVEVDGESHVGRTNVKDDLRRQTYLASCGIEVVRVGNQDVMTNLEGVLEYIRAEIMSRTSPSPSLERRGRQNT